MIENLEVRRFLSAELNSVNQIAITGSESADVVSVRVRGEEIVVTERGGRTAFPRTSVTGMVATLGGGNDRLRVGPGLGVSVVADGGDGNDVLVGGIDPVEFRGGEGNDRLVGGGGSDTLLDGGAGDDMVLGRAGADFLSGDQGNDRLSGGDGADTVSGGDGADRLDGGAGDDFVNGSLGDDRLGGGRDSDVLWAHEGRDVVRGGAGIDVARLASREARPGGVDVIETEAPTHTDVAPVSASVSIAGDAERGNSATVMVTLPGPGYRVLWGTPTVQYTDGAPSGFELDVSLLPVDPPVQPPDEPTGLTVSRTFSLGTTSSATFTVRGPGGAVLASQPFTLPAPAPFGTAPLAMLPNPGRIAVRPVADGLEALFSIFFPGLNAEVTFGQVTREGDEFVLDASARMTSGPPMEDAARNEFALGALAPGLYALTLRSPAGVVQSVYFEVL